MRVRSILVWRAGITAVLAAILTRWHYRRWKQYEYQRLQSESHLLETIQGTVEYWTEGTGSVILMLHGSPGGYDQGKAIAHLLDLSAYTFLSPSRPGYRRTPLSSGQTPEAQADLFAATLEALHVPQAMIIALSGGGPSALQFALRHPQRCRGLVLVCALGYSYTEEEVYRSLPPGQRLLKRLFDRLLDWNPLLYLLQGLSKLTSFEAQAIEFIDSLVMNSVYSAGYHNDMQQFATLPHYPFQDVTLPTLIVHGIDDIDVPFRQAQELANTIPNAQLVAIRDADHLSLLTNQRAIAAIHTFLQKLSSEEAKR